MGKMMLLYLLSFSSAPTVATSGHPNLVVALVDDLGFNDCWLPQCDLYKAWPHVSKLASEGIVINSFYTAWMCTPTRGALMTGRYPTRLGLHHYVISGFRDYGLPLNETTLADKLKRVGYETHAVGKWHLGGYSDASTPLARGFDSTFGYLNGEEDHYTHRVYDVDDLNDGLDYKSVPELYRGRHGAFVFAEKAVEVVETARAPFFLYYALQNAHSPLEAPDAYAGEEPCASIASISPDRAIFCALVVMADEAIHNVTSRLNAAETLVVVAGDNGGLISAGGNNWPLRGQKAEPWEGGIRNHAFFWGFGIHRHRFASNVYTKGYVHVVDVHATLLALANASSRDQSIIDGVNIFDAITKDLPSPRQEFLAMYDPCSRECDDGRCTSSTFAYVYNDYKLIKPASHLDGWYLPAQPNRTTNTSRLRPGPSGSVLWNDEDDPCLENVDDTLHLYNLRLDPEERNNLAAMKDVSHEVNETMHTIYNHFLASLAGEMAPCNIPNGSCYDDDPIGEQTCTQSGYWKPWVHDNDSTAITERKRLVR